MNLARKVFLMLSPTQRRAAIVLLGWMVGGTVLEMMGIGLVVPLLALMTRPDALLQYPPIASWLKQFGHPDHEQLLIASTVLLVGIYTLKAAYLAVLSWKQAKYSFGLQAELSQGLFASYLRQPYAFHLQRNSAELVHNAINQIDQFRWVVNIGLLLVAEGLVIFGLCALLMMMEFLGAVLVVGTVVVALWLFQSLTRAPLLRWGKGRQAHERLRLQHLQQGLGSVKDIKVLGREKEFLAQYWTHNSGNALMGQRQYLLEALPRLWLEVLTVVGLSALVAVMIAQGKPTERFVPTLGLFAAVTFRVMPSVNRIVSGIQNVQFFLPVVDSLYNELQTLHSQLQADIVSEAPFLLNEGLVIRDLSYRYPSTEAPALSGINLSVRKGTSIGIIGTTGAGKSTLVDLILGLLTPTNGTVKVDGVDIHTNLRGWQAQLGYVPQSIYLTDDTLRRNVAFGLENEQIDESAVLRAVRAAQLEPWVCQLPQGLDTVVGERGVRLSGGQRQRIGIARALYHDPQVLVLDEATSSLDGATESAFMNGVEVLRGEKTLIIVAHRLSTVSQCDRLFRLEGGQLVAEGTPAVMVGGGQGGAGNGGSGKSMSS